MRLFALSIVGKALFVEVKYLQYSAKYSVGNIPDVFLRRNFVVTHCVLSVVSFLCLLCKNYVCLFKNNS